MTQRHIAKQHDIHIIIGSKLCWLREKYVCPNPYSALSCNGYYNDIITFLDLNIVNVVFDQKPFLNP